MILLAAVLLLNSCTPLPPPTPAPGEIELPFESIDRASEFPSSIRSGRQPSVVLVTRAEEIEEHLSGRVEARALTALQSFDFGKYFVVAVFRGGTTLGGYSVTIRRVARRGEQLVVYAELGESSPRFPKPAITTAPYHLVRVQRDGVALEQENVVLLTWNVYTQ
jgi:hypothetical protein